MLSVALITPRFSETGCSAGLYTHALATLLCESGIACDVICSRSPAPCPGHFESGLMRIHRLPVRRGTPWLGFETLAAKRMHELQTTRRASVVVCIDTPHCADLLRILLCSSCCIAQIGVEGIGNSQLDRLHSSIPIVKGLWSPPDFESPTLLATGAQTDASQEMLVEAYRKSNAPKQGWSLALLEDDGSWSMREQSAGIQKQADRILLTLQPGLPVLPTLAAAHGIASIIHDDKSTSTLLRAINESIRLTPEHRTASACAVWDEAQIKNANDEIVTEIRSICGADSPIADCTSMKYWVQLEDQLAHSRSGAAI